MIKILDWIKKITHRCVLLTRDILKYKADNVGKDGKRYVGTNKKS